VCKSLCVLSIEDVEAETLLVMDELRRAGYQPSWARVDSARSMAQALERQPWDVAISDHPLTHFNAFDALALLRENQLDLPFIVVSGRIGEDTAVQVMKSGAHDCIMKDCLPRLVPAIERELREAEGRRERRRTEAALQESEARFRSITSKVPGMVFQMLRSADGALRFTYASEGAAALCGVPREAIQADGSAFTRLIFPSDREDFHRSLDLSARTMRQWNWEGRLRTPRNAVKWTNCRASPKLLDGGEVLWDGLMLNITEARLREAEVHESRELLQELSAYRESAREEERKRIAHNIHEELGQVLTALSLDIACLDMRFGEGRTEFRHKTASMARLIDRAVEVVRGVAAELRPGVLDLGLAAAIEWQAEEFEARTGIPCLLRFSDRDVALDEKRATTLFRILQESLCNVARHADAASVTITLARDGDWLSLEVADDGRGVDPQRIDRRKSFGLLGIRERTAVLGGKFEVRGSTGNGTVLSVRVPLEPGGE
jgi:signal transduction histidine kinase